MFYKYRSIVFLLIALTSICYSQVNKNLNNRFRLGQSYERAGRYDKAVEIYKDLLKIEPWNNQYMQALNKLFINQKDYPSSIDLLKKRIIAVPTDVNAYGMLGSTFYTMGDTENAFITWEKGIQINPSNIIGYRVIANYIIENRAFDKAVEILKKGKEHSKDPKIFSYDLANLYAITMKFSDAAEEYCMLLKYQPNQLEMVKRRISNYLSTENAALQTITVVEKYAEDENQNIFLDLLSFLYTQTNQYEKALKVVVEKDNRLNRNGSALFNFAQNAFKENKFEAASEAYELVINKYPNSPITPNAKIGFSQSMEAKLNIEFDKTNHDWKPYRVPDTAGAFRYNVILKAYEDIIKLYPNTEIANAALYSIGLIYQDRFLKYDLADSIFQSIAKSSPLSKTIPFVLERLGIIAIIKGDLTSAKNYYNEILKNKRINRQNKLRAKFAIAKIDFWKNDFDSADEILNEILKTLSDDNANDALELSVILLTLKTDSLNLGILAKAQFLSEQFKFKEAAEEYRILSENQNLLLLNDLSKYKLAQMKIAMNDFPAAINILRELSKPDNHSVYSDKALFLLANTYQFGMKDFDKALSSYEKLLENFPNSLYFDISREFINVIRTKKSKTI